MSLHPGLAGDLASLSRALEAPDDLVTTLQSLRVSAAASVPSLVGLTLFLRAPTFDTSPESTPVRMTFLDEGAPTSVDLAVGSSLLVPLLAAGSSHQAGAQGPTTEPWDVQIVLYATTPGAFVDLAADLAWLRGIPLGEIMIDQHLTTPPPSGDGRSTLAGASLTDQAIGALLGQGLTPVLAAAELARRADEGEGDVADAAERLLLDL